MKPLLNYRPIIAAALAVIMSASELAIAEPLPSVDDLETQIGSRPITIEVIEPHLSDAENHTVVAYVGYRAEQVLSVALGGGWQERGDAIEFRALDGYVSRIEMSRLESGNAFVVFSRADRAEFVIDNLAQNQENVPLGPYYLVWDNISNPELLAEGAGNWPYQVSEVTVSSVSEDALLPQGLAVPFRRGAELAKAHCLNCHRINGYGGDKFDGDLAAVTKNLARTHFVSWVLQPAAFRSDTTMPALSTRIGEAERVQVASLLYDYLVNMPESR